jgi:hypothetical protein
LRRRENQNILELEVDEMLTDSITVMEGLEMDEFVATIIEGIILLRALNSPSPRFSSFLNPALLGFPGRSVEMPQGNS